MKPITYLNLLCLTLLLTSCGGGSGDAEQIFSGTYFTDDFTPIGANNCQPPLAAVELESPKLMHFSDVGAAKWPDFLENIGNVIDQNYSAQLLSIREIGSIAGQNKFHGGVLGPDGNIYLIPSSSNLIYYFNPDDPLLKTIGGFGTANQSWNGGVLAANGKIYSLPWSLVNPRILEIDTSSKTIRTIPVATGGYGGQILAGNGKIYGIPDDAQTILEFDPATDATNYITAPPGTLTGSRKYFGGVLAPNGSIYAVPLNASTILKFNPDTHEFVFFGALPTGDLKWAGGILAPNGHIYAVPDDAREFLSIDTNTDTIQIFGHAGTAVQKWSFGLLAPNGLLYFIPDDAPGLLELDWLDNSIRTVGIYNGADKWNGAVLALNGKFYTVPDSDSRILEIDLCLAQTFDKDLTLSTYLNKY